jgi:hypothetical protein
MPCWYGRQDSGVSPDVDYHGTALVRECHREALSHIARFFDADALRAHRIGDLGEIRVLEINPERDHAGFLHLDIDEVERFVVEDNLDDRRLPLHLGQQIPEPEHGEPAVAAGA